MKKSLTQYTLYFGLIYVGVTILFAIIASFISSAGSSGSVIAPFLAAMVVSNIFIKSEKRAPNDQERNKLAVYSLAVYLAINFALLGLAFVGGVFEELTSGSNIGNTLWTILIVVFAVLSLIIFFMLRWAYGGLARKSVSKILGDQNNTFD